MCIDEELKDKQKSDDMLFMAEIKAQFHSVFIENMYEIINEYADVFDYDEGKQHLVRFIIEGFNKKL